MDTEVYHAERDSVHASLTDALKPAYILSIEKRGNFWFIVRPDGTTFSSMKGDSCYETENIARTVVEYAQSTKPKSPTHRIEDTARLRREHRRIIGAKYGVSWSQTRGFYELNGDEG